MLLVTVTLCLRLSRAESQCPFHVHASVEGSHISHFTFDISDGLLHRDAVVGQIEHGFVVPEHMESLFFVRCDGAKNFESHLHVMNLRSRG